MLCRAMTGSILRAPTETSLEMSLYEAKGNDHCLNLSIQSEHLGLQLSFLEDENIANHYLFACTKRQLRNLVEG